MPNTRLYSRSFAGGEIGPLLYGRVDAQQYQTGAERLRNFVVTPQGALERRFGMQFVAAAKNSSAPVIVRRFVFNTDETLVLELGENATDLSGIGRSKGYIRFYSNGAPVTVAGLTAWSAASVDYVVGDLVSYLGTNYYCMFAHESAALVNPSTSQQYWHPLVGTTYEIPTPYDGDDLKELTFFQSNDVVTILHQDYYPSELRRYSATRWILSQLDFYGSKIASPTGVAAVGTVGEAVRLARLRAKSGSPNQGSVFVETQNPISLYVLGDSLTIANTRLSQLNNTLLIINSKPSDTSFWPVAASTGNPVELQTPVTTARWHVSFTNATPGVVTWTAQQLTEGTRIRFGTTGALGLFGGVPASSSTDYYVRNPSGSTFNIATSPGGATLSISGASAGATDHEIFVYCESPTDQQGILSPASRGTDLTNYYVVTAVDDDGAETRPSDPASVTNNLYVANSYNTVSWLAVADAVRYRVYKKQNGVYGYIGETDRDTLTFKDDNLGPDLSISPPIPDRTMGERMPVASVAVSPTNELTFGVEHPFSQNERVRMVYGPYPSALPAGTSSGTTYYVDVVSERVIRLLDANGNVISLSSIGSGTFYVQSIDDWPRAGCYFEGRRVFAGTTDEPQAVWMTRAGTESDLSYSFPTRDDDRIKFAVAAREASTIRHVVPVGHLLLLTNSSEFRVTPLNSDTLTPGNVSVRPQSYIGANSVAPLIVNNQVVYCAARGGHVREMGWNADFEGFVTGDLSLRAAHLFDDEDLVDACYQKAHYPILWFVSTSGQLLGLTYVPEERVGAWHVHESTSCVFESCCTVPEAGDDVLYVVANRGGVRYIERMLPDGVPNYPLRLDCATVQTGTSSTVTGLTRFAGQQVWVSIDGVAIAAPVTVSGGGVATLPYAPTTEVHVGLSYTSTLRTLPLVADIEASAQGRVKNINRAWLKVQDAYRIRVGPTDADLDLSIALDRNTPSDADVDVALLPDWTTGGSMAVVVDRAYPLTILGVTVEASIGG